VIAIATRGHGKSELGTKTISYQLYAEDYAAVIKNVTTAQVNVLGFSDGAIAAYHLTANHPEIVKRLISVGGPLGSYGYSEKGVRELSSYDTAEKLGKSFPDFAADRKKLLPNEASWNRFIDELARMWKQPEYISKDRIKTIKCPVLIAGGDRDEYSRAEHLVEIYRLLPNGQLAIVPNSEHTAFESRPDLMLRLVRNFLGKDL
jgi:pimeloyl-ACP methyl ester carboxylesterase